MRPALILDVDGTVWRYGRLIPGVAEALQQLRRDGYPLLFLSNNPVPPELYADRLVGMGVPTAPSEILTCLTILEAELAQEAEAGLYVVADDRLQAHLAEGHRIAADPAAIDIVLATGPYDLTYDRLNVAFQALRRGANFWATNADPFVLARSGGEVPHTAAVIGALQGCTGRTVERMTGKPSPLSARAALERLGCGPGEAIVVGDGLDTDIALGHNAGIRTVLLLSGVTRREDLADSPVQPDFVLDSLASLPDLLRGPAAR
ncbi:MAG: hypothetical protein A2Y93_10515 [Chloroflexi bacterium RBG_13_68_17]|nr:MAG: hypothetical protein A2Y93_10515 [Chloroflexi bacterium RBG_13_68_17]